MKLSEKQINKAFAEAWMKVSADNDIRDNVYKQMLEEISFPLAREQYEAICLKYNVEIKKDSACLKYKDSNSNLPFVVNGVISSHIRFFPEYIHDIRAYSLEYFKDFSEKGGYYEEYESLIDHSKTFFDRAKATSNIMILNFDLLGFPLSREKYEKFCKKTNMRPEQDLYCKAICIRDKNKYNSNYIVQKKLNTFENKLGFPHLEIEKFVNYLRGSSYIREQRRNNSWFSLIKKQGKKIFCKA